MKSFVTIGVLLSCAGAVLGNVVILDPNMDIQAAINGSQDGDTIILYRGTYPVGQAITFGDRGITLTSEEPNDPNTVASTILARQSDSPDGRIFEFTQGEDPNTLIRGLTIRGGKAPQQAIANDPNLAAGGAVLCDHASPKFLQCAFEDNKAEQGGAIYAMGSRLVVEACSFSNNNADGLPDSAGGAICLNGSPALISDCLFEDNTASPEMPEDLADPGTGGGAICCADGSNAFISGCTLRANQSDDDGGAICCQFGSCPVVTDCSIIQNDAGDAGGGIYCRYNSNPVIQHCVLTGNRAPWGAGLFHRGGVGLSVVHCTFTGNRASTAGGAIRVSRNSQGGTLSNSILWANEAPSEESIAVYAGSRIEVAYCDVAGAFPGDGNMDADSLFAIPGHWDPNGTPNSPDDDVWVDGDYHLQSQRGRWDPNEQTWVGDTLTSPCIDQGDPMSPWDAEPWPNGQRANLGAFGGTWQASLSLDLSGKPSNL